MRIAASDHTSSEGEAIEAITRFLREAGEHLGIHDRFELSLVLVGAEEMRALNSEYMDREGDTDVLAFPLLERDEISEVGEEGDEDLLGDLVICSDLARSQSMEMGHDYLKEMAFLATHGLLHILGFAHDDEGDAGHMRMKENELMGVWEESGIGREGVGK